MLHLLNWKSTLNILCGVFKLETWGHWCWTAMCLLVSSVFCQWGDRLADQNLRPHAWGELSSLAEAYQI